MTEQEKREKAIREMADIDGDLSRCGEPPRVLGKCKYESCPICRAERLYDAGYRKADEVQKETAIKILNGLVDIAEKFIGDDYKGIFAAQVAIEMEEFIKKEFGVEVEE